MSACNNSKEVAETQSSGLFLDFCDSWILHLLVAWGRIAKVAQARPRVEPANQGFAVIRQPDQLFKFLNTCTCILMFKIMSHTHLHICIRMWTGRSCIQTWTRMATPLYMGPMTAPITHFFCRIWLTHIKRCVKKIVIAYVFETCLLQDFEKKELYIFCA